MWDDHCHRPAALENPVEADGRWYGLILTSQHVPRGLVLVGERLKVQPSESVQATPWGMRGESIPIRRGYY